MLARIRLLDVLIDRICSAAEMTHREDASVLRDLGAACEALGFSAEARAWYDLALARDPLDPETQGALHRLRTSRPTAAPRVIPPGEACGVRDSTAAAPMGGPWRDPGLPACVPAAATSPDR